jgi:hypothetical protein
MNTKSLFAITAIPLLGLSIFMSTKPLTVQTDTNVERQEFSIVEKQAKETEIKVTKVDTKVEEIATVQAEQAKKIEEVKNQVQEVKTVYVQAPTPAPAPEPVKVEVKIDYDKLIYDKAMTKTGFFPMDSTNKFFGFDKKFYLRKMGTNTWNWSTDPGVNPALRKMTEAETLTWLDTID